MKAMVNSSYSRPEGLELRDVKQPVPKDNEVLVKVHATAINDWDWGILEGKQWIIRVLYGLKKPRINILGCDVAGQVGAVGSRIQRFKPGDEVFGDLSFCGFGGFAEYVCAPEKAFIAKPPTMSFQQAAAMPQAGAIAVQSIDLADVRQGREILVNGAGGGVGTFFIQLAKLRGAQVTGVDTGAKLGLLRSLGFDQVIEYTQVDFTRMGKRYDLVVDTKTNRPPSDYARALKPGGLYLTVGGSMPRVFQGLCLSPWIRATTQTRSRVLALKPNEGIRHLVELFEAGKLKPVIDRQYSLTELPEAFRRFAAAEHQGKIVISLAGEP